MTKQQQQPRTITRFKAFKRTPRDMYMMGYLDGQHGLPPKPERAENLPEPDEQPASKPASTVEALGEKTTPAYYQLGDQDPYELLKHLEFGAASACKYLIRACRIDGVKKGSKRKDLLKARDYINRLIQDLD